MAFGNNGISCRMNKIGHIRVPKTLTFKMRLDAQPFLWKWVLFAWEWKMIAISKAEHLPSLWNRGPVELEMAYFALCKGIQIMESWKFFPESRILGFGIRKTAHGFQNQTNDWNPESKFHWQTLEFITLIRNPRRGIQNPAMTVNSLTWGVPLGIYSVLT